ncbi:MAG: hypothetical protein KIT36_07540 [Alphaproteobacteria bacterium]|nr:hypothetical protein [Alphaproteobacteria bacterium]
MVGRAILSTAAVVALVWALDALLPAAVAAAASVVVIVVAFVVYARMDAAAGRAGRARGDRGRVHRAGPANLPGRLPELAELPSGRHLDYRPPVGRGATRSRRVVVETSVDHGDAAGTTPSDDVIRR